jgi:hypothetical protein
VYGYHALPFIDGVCYDTTGLNTSTWVKVHTCDNSSQLRQWLAEHFRFFGVDTNKSIRKVWPYTDLFWHPFDFCLENNEFEVEDNVVYVKLVPC